MPPKQKVSSKKPAAKKVPAKRSPAKKAPVKKAQPKKPAAKKVSVERAKAPVARNSAKKLAAEGSTTSSVKKTGSAKKPAPKRTPAKKATKATTAKKAKRATPVTEPAVPLVVKSVKAESPLESFYHIFSEKASDIGFVSFIAMNAQIGDPFPLAKSFLEKNCKLALVAHEKTLDCALYEAKAYPGAKIYTRQLGSSDNGIWILVPLSHPLAKRDAFDLFQEVMEAIYFFKIPHVGDWEVLTFREQGLGLHGRQPQGQLDPGLYTYLTSIKAEVVLQEDGVLLDPRVLFRLDDSSGKQSASASLRFVENESDTCGPVIENFKYVDDVAGIALVEQVELYLADQCHIDYCKLKMATAFEGEHDVVRKYCHFKQDSEGEDDYVHKEIRIDDCGWYHGLHYRQDHWSTQNDWSDSDGGSDMDDFDDEEDSDDDSDVGWRTTRRCKGINRYGERCKVTSDDWYDSAEPLRDGQNYCTYHDRY